MSHHLSSSKPPPRAKRAFNFSPGPAMLPTQVLEQIASEMLGWRDGDISVTEMSHRSPEFLSIYEQAITDLRDLLEIPKHFKILLLQGGGIGQNAAVPLNIANKGTANFIVTGAWSEKSVLEANKYCTTHVAANAKTSFNGYYGIPDPQSWQISEHASYVHICSNETVHGVEFHDIPDLKSMTGYDIPLVLDMSSHILSRPVDWTRIGVAFAGAQKNIGISGLTLVFVREDLLGKASSICPTVFNYEVMSKSDSMYNTPPTFAIYVAGLIFQWIKHQGGVRQMEKNAIERSQLLYQHIDNSQGFYVNPVQTQARSRMNVPFFLHNEELNKQFLVEAKENCILNLKGHKSTGGMRASLYNSMPIEGAHTLVDFMKQFAKKYG